ncbi:hypothetical protein HanPI659440_Chr13g0521761 [Helianthus annuus]|nr:hypothetical protein HanPI659440_Chr13g0521761 [Helianthus annuus]
MVFNGCFLIFNFQFFEFVNFWRSSTSLRRWKQPQLHARNKPQGRKQ